LPAVIREYQANTYAPSAYFLAVVLADSVQYLIHPTIYSLIIYLMAGYSRSFSQYLLFNLLNITVANVSTSVAYAAASICGRLTIAVIFVPMVINSSLIFAGFFIDLRTIPVYFAVLPHLSWFKYAYEAYMIVLLKPIEEIVGCPSENPYDATVCSAKNGVEVLLSLGFHPGFYLVNFTILLIFIIFIRGIALIAFSIRVRRS
uniref:ABC2_membrane domain-containing protein n=1 Tax=Haemonchus placei TaxID=6290 RepID=A0A0N4W1F2_HAEPC